MPCLSMRWAWHFTFVEEPTPYEQDLAFAYSKRKLNRPSLTYWQFTLKWLSAFVLMVVLFVFVLWLTHYFALSFGVSICLFCGIFLLSSFSLRWFMIDCVKLYQHYAPDDVRRRCHMIPSCSDYAIISLKKYGLIIGVVLSCTRLYKRCDGTYRIEYPSLKHLKYVFVS